MNKGIVVAPEPMAAEVGAEVLRNGGNAFDAAVATGFMQMAIDPVQCGLGGWGSGTVFDARTGKSESLGFWARIGSKMRPDMWVDDVKGYTDMWRFAIFDDDRAYRGYTSIMTPGTVAGFGELHARYCTRPWAELLQPSIEACRKGFRLPEYLAIYLGGKYLPGLPTPREIFCTTPDSEKLWMRDGGDRFIERGEHYANPDMAKILERLADVGPDDFYRGQIADTIVKDFEKNGAFVTRQDLAEYEVEKEEPLVGSYRGYDLVASTLPSGGIMALQMLNILENFDLSKMEHNGPEHAKLLAGAMAWAAVTRFSYLVDPRFKDVPIDWLISKEYGRELADKIHAGEIPSDEVIMKPGGTTHLCTMDSQGNCVTLTQTLTCYSGVVVPGTGFSWNNCVSMMDPVPGCNNSLDPGRARATAMAPMILFKDGKPKMVVGAAGGWSITSVMLQTIVNLVDFGMSPVEAVSAPRFHCEGSPLFCESRIPQSTIRELRSDGLKVKQVECAYHWMFGRVQCILCDEIKSHFTGASDPRGDGGTAITASGENK